MLLRTALWSSLPLVVSCVNPALQTHPTNNPDVDVQLLFTHEGCRVYRFSDGGYHYYVRCDGAPSAAAFDRRSCGKGCTYTEEVPTADATRP